jgi:hypothetical protein
VYVYAVTPLKFTEVNINVWGISFSLRIQEQEIWFHVTVDVGISRQVGVGVKTIKHRLSKRAAFTLVRQVLYNKK